MYFSYFIAKQGTIFKDICIKEDTQFCSAYSSSGLIYHVLQTGHLEDRYHARVILSLLYTMKFFCIFLLNQFFQKILFFAFWRKKIRSHFVKGVLL